MAAVRGGARTWLLACLCVAACGGDDTSEHASIPDLDASVVDASHGLLDATLPPDATSPADATTVAPLGPDGATMASTKPACVFDRDTIISVAKNGVSPADPLALVVRNEGAALSWVQIDSGKRRLSQGWFSASTSEVVGVPFADVASNQLEPASTATTTGFLTIWSDDVNGVSNLHSGTMTAAGAQVDPVSTALTTDAASDDRTAVALGADGNVLVVWQSQSKGHALLAGPDGKPMGQPTDIPDYGASVGRPALAKLGTSYILAWVDSSARRVHVQRLDSKGALSGPSTLIDSEGDAQGKVDLVTTNTGGAITFDVLVAGQRPEVRFRAFDAAGAPTDTERVVTQYPDTGLMPAMVPLRGGFAVAYRSAATTDLALRMALLDRFGAVIASSTIAPIYDLNLAVALRASPDGAHLFLTWVDLPKDTVSYQLQRTWVHCD